MADLTHPAAAFGLGAALGAVLRGIRIAGGLVLLLIAVSSLVESIRGPSTEEPAPPRLPPFARGVLAVVFNPGAFVFLATSASALLAEASVSGGRGFAFVTAVAMLVGVMLVDGSTVALAAGGRRFLGSRGRIVLGAVLAAGLAALGVWLLVQGLA